MLPGLKALQRVLELLVGQQAGQAIRHLRGRTVSDGGRRGLSLNGLFFWEDKGAFRAGAAREQSLAARHFPA